MRSRVYDMLCFHSSNTYTRGQTAVVWYINDQHQPERYVLKVAQTNATSWNLLIGVEIFFSLLFLVMVLFIHSSLDLPCLALPCPPLEIHYVVYMYAEWVIVNISSFFSKFQQSNVTRLEFHFGCDEVAIWRWRRSLSLSSRLVGCSSWSGCWCGCWYTNDDRLTYKTIAMAIQISQSSHSAFN